MIQAQDEARDLLENQDPTQAQVRHHLLEMELVTPQSILVAQSWALLHLVLRLSGRDKLGVLKVLMKVRYTDCISSQYFAS